MRGRPLFRHSITILSISSLFPFKSDLAQRLQLLYPSTLPSRCDQISQTLAHVLGHDV